LVKHTNVNDAAFLGDGRSGDYYRNEDVRRDLNAGAEALRDTMIDMYGSPAYIFGGLRVVDGTALGTFAVQAGRCRDNGKYSIIVPALVDDIVPAALLPAGLTNYIAVRHVWAYANPDAACKTGIAYNRQRSDFYEIGVALTPYAEKDGWVRLAAATPVAGAWVYDMESISRNATAPTEARSLSADPGEWTIDFSYSGLPGNDLMDRHSIIGGPAAGPTGNIWRVPFDLLVCRVEVDARVAGGANTNINLWQGIGAHPNWFPGELVLLLGSTNAIWYDPEGIASGVAAAIQYYKDDLIQVELAPAGAPPTDLTVIISGRQTGNV